MDRCKDGLPWCDFVVYLSGSHSLYVERICFVGDYWNNTLLPKLTPFYFKHAIAFLKKKRLYNPQNLTIRETVKCLNLKKISCFKLDDVCIKLS